MLHRQEIALIFVSIFSPPIIYKNYLGKIVKNYPKNFKYTIYEILPKSKKIYTPHLSNFTQIPNHL